MHEVFDTNAFSVDDYIQTGGGGPVEGLNEEFTIYRGGPLFQRGYGYMKGGGVGDVFRGIWRFFLPLIRKAGTTISKEALETGQRVIEQLKEGKPMKETLISEGKKGMDNVLEQGGLPKQFGTGLKKSIKRRASRKQSITFPNHQTVIGTTISKPLAYSKKRLRSDAFGLY